MILSVNRLPRSRHDPKIPWVDDAKIGGDQVTEIRPIPGDLSTQEAEGRSRELAACGIISPSSGAPRGSRRPGPAVAWSGFPAYNRGPGQGAMPASRRVIGNPTVGRPYGAAIRYPGPSVPWAWAGLFTP